MMDDEEEDEDDDDDGRRSGGPHNKFGNKGWTKRRGRNGGRDQWYKRHGTRDMVDEDEDGR